MKLLQGSSTQDTHVVQMQDASTLSRLQKLHDNYLHEVREQAQRESEAAQRAQAEAEALRHQLEEVRLACVNNSVCVYTA